MSTNSTCAQPASPLHSTHPSAVSDDAGALELGVESAWTRNDSFVAGADRDSSRWGEPPTDRLRDLGGAECSPRESPVLALEAPDASSTPVPTGSDDVKSLTPLMVASPLGGTVKNLSWAELPDDGELGDVPQFPLLSPSRPSSPSTPRIPAELKGKGVDRCERPDSADPDESLRKLWDDNDRRLNENERVVADLRNQVRDLERMVMTSQVREEEALRLVKEAYRAPTVSPGWSGTRVEPIRHVSIKIEEPKVARALESVKSSITAGPAPSVADPVQPGNYGTPQSKEPNIRYGRASSLLPASSSVRRAITGNDPGDDSPSSSSSDDDEHSSTESS